MCCVCKKLHPPFCCLLGAVEFLSMLFGVIYFLMVFALTFIVSKGCPDATRHIPPKPPAKKFLTGLTLFSSDILFEVG